MSMGDEHSNSPPYLEHTKRRRLDVNTESHTNPASLPHDYYNPFQPAPYYPSQFAYGLTPRMHSSVGAKLRAEDASAFSRDPGVRSAMAARNQSMPASWRAAVVQSAEHLNVPGGTPATPYLYGNVNVNAPFVSPLSGLHPLAPSCSAPLSSPSNHVLAGPPMPVPVPAQLTDLSPSHSGPHRIPQNLSSGHQPLPPSDIDVVKSLRDVVHELHDIRDMVVVLASKTDSLFVESQTVKTDLSQLAGNVRKLLGYFQGSPSPRGEPQGAELKKQPVLVSNGPITSLEGTPMQMSAPDRQVSPPTVPPSSLFSTKCANCSTTKTPQWRWEDGKRLCNACGLVVRLKKKREQVKKKESTPTTSNFSSPPQSLATALMNSTNQNGVKTVASSAGSSAADDSPVSSDINVHGSEPDKESTSERTETTHTYGEVPGVVVDSAPNELKPESTQDEKRDDEIAPVLTAEPEPAVPLMDVSTAPADDKMEDASPNRSVSSAESCSVFSLEESVSSSAEPTSHPSGQSTIVKHD